MNDDREWRIEREDRIAAEDRPGKTAKRPSPGVDKPRRRRIPRWALIAGGVFVLLLTAILVAPGFIDWSPYRNRIAGLAAEATGREVTIAGDISFTLLPAPALQAGQVSVANAPGGAAEHFATLERLDVVVALWPLISGNIDVERIVLDKPDIALEVLADGSGNWELETGTKEADAPAESGRAVRVEDFTINDGRIRYTDLRSGESRTVDAIDASLSAGSLSGPFRLSGSAESQGVPVTLDARGEAFAADRRTPVRADMALGSGRASYSGWLQLPQSEGAVQAGGALELEGASLSGFLTALAEIAGTTPPALPSPASAAFTLSADLAADTRIGLSNLRARLGNSTLSGDLSYDPGAGPAAAIGLRIDRLRLDDWLPPPSGTTSAGTTSAGPTSSGPTSTGDAEPFTVGETLLPPELQATVSLGVDAVEYGDGVARSVAFEASAADGAMTIDRASAELPGGATLRFEGRAFAETGAPALEGALTAAAANLRAVLIWLGVPVDAVPDGQLTSFALDTKLTAMPGSLTLRELDAELDVSALAGEAAVRLDGETAEIDADLSLDRLDLDAYLPPDPQTDPAPADLSTLAARLDQSLAALDTVSGRVALKAGQLRANETVLSDARLRLVLEGGTVRAEELSVADLSGARIAASGTLGHGPRLDAELLFEAADFGPLARQFGLALPVDAAALGTVVVKGRAEGGLDRLTLDLNGEAAGATLTLIGELEAIASLPERVDLDLSLSHPDQRALARRLSLAALAQADAAPMRLAAKLDGDAASMAVALEGALLGGTLSADGTVATPYQTPSLTLSAQAEHPALIKLVRQFDPGYEPARKALGGASVSAGLTGTAEKIALDEIRASIGPAEIAGTLALDRTGAKPRFEAAFTVGRLALPDFLPAQASGAESASASPQARWSRKPFDLSALSDLDGAATLSADELSYGVYALEDAEFDLTVEDGVARLSKADGTLFGGKTALTAEIDGRSEPNLRLAVDLQGGRLADALAAVTGRRPAAGVLDLKGRFTARGNSQYALIDSLNGDASLTARDGMLKGLDIPQLSARLKKVSKPGDVGRVLKAAISGGQTPFSRLTAGLVARDGVLAAERIASDVEGAALTAAARADLAAWTLTATGQFGLAGRPGAPPIGFELRGNLSDPVLAFQTEALKAHMVKKLAAGALKKIPLPEGGLGELLGAPEVVGGEDEPDEDAGEDAEDAEDAAPASPKGGTDQPVNPLNRLLDALDEAKKKKKDGGS